MSFVPNRNRKIDSGKLRELLQGVYHGPIKETKAGLQICCPWHDDHNPSCFIFEHSAIFFCMVCHGDKKKGQRGANPYRGFLALGMPEARARKIFLEGTEDCTLDFNHLPALDSFEPAERRKPILEEKVVSRSEWPKFWDFREIEYTTMITPWFKKRFDPTLVALKRERIPRIALAIGGAEKYKNTNQPHYLRHEVFLRLSSAVKPKAVNSVGLSLDPDSISPPSASLFGLCNNKVVKGCKGIFLVEGPMDAMRLLQHIYQLPEPNCGKFEVVALLGTPQWHNILKQLQIYIMPGMDRKEIPIILAFDNDAAGIKLTATAIRDLQDTCYLPASRIKILNYPLSIKDPGELPFDIFFRSLQSLGLI